jgi:hypothetical protein
MGAGAPSDANVGIVMSCFPVEGVAVDAMATSPQGRNFPKENRALEALHSTAGIRRTRLHSPGYRRDERFVTMVTQSRLA